MRVIERVDQIPARGHWAILENVETLVPGDERSRTALGHGYPEHIERSIRYLAYFDEGEFKTALENASAPNAPHAGVKGVYVMGTYAVRTRVIVEKEYQETCRVRDSTYR